MRPLPSMSSFVHPYLQYISKFYFIYRNYNKMKASIFAFLCLLSSLALKINHLQSSSYLNSLKSQQQSIIPQITLIKNQIASFQTNLNNQQDIAKKIKLLEEAIIKHKKLVNLLTFSLSAPLNESSWSCQTLSFSSKSQINSYANNIASSSTSLSAYINSMPNSNISSYFSPQSNAIKTFSDQIQKDTLSSGKQVSTIEPGSYTNWLNSNWATGNLSLQEIEQQMKLINEGNNYYVICPQQIPFFNGKDCISCQNGKYFLLSSKSCVICDSFDSVTHTCKNNTSPTPQNNSINGSNIISGGNRIILPAGTTIESIQTTPLQSCPNDKPFYTIDKQCINCEVPNALFDWSLKRCTTCPVSTTFSVQKHSCISQQKRYVTNIPISSTRLILPDGITLESLQIQQQKLAVNYQIISCPTDKPFFNNVICLNCESNQYFSISSLTCQSCPSGTQYNITSFKCNSIFYYSNLINRNWTSTNPTTVQQSAINSSKLIGSTVCPISTPFFNNLNCINCPVDQYFNFDGLKCQNCPLNTFFSANQHSCVKSEQGFFQTNPNTATNLIYDGISKGQWSTIYLQNQQINPMIKDCPIDRPYFDGLRCISCSSKAPYFNLKHKICQFCDPDSIYDATVHECLSNSGQIIDQKPTIEKMIASIFT